MSLTLPPQHSFPYTHLPHTTTANAIYEPNSQHYDDDNDNGSIINGNDDDFLFIIPLFTPTPHHHTKKKIPSFVFWVLISSPIGHTHSPTIFFFPQQEIYPLQYFFFFSTSIHHHHHFAGLIGSILLFFFTHLFLGDKLTFFTSRPVLVFSVAQKEKRGVLSSIIMTTRTCTIVFQIDHSKHIQVYFGNRQWVVVLSVRLNSDANFLAVNWVIQK